MRKEEPWCWERLFHSPAQILELAEAKLHQLWTFPVPLNGPLPWKTNLHNLHAIQFTYCRAWEWEEAKAMLWITKLWLQELGQCGLTAQALSLLPKGYIKAICTQASSAIRSDLSVWPHMAKDAATSHVSGQKEIVTLCGFREMAGVSFVWHT